MGEAGDVWSHSISRVSPRNGVAIHQGQPGAPQKVGRPQVASQACSPSLWLCGTVFPPRSFFKKILLFVYFWLLWVFVMGRGWGAIL